MRRLILLLGTAAIALILGPGPSSAQQGAQAHLEWISDHTATPMPWACTGDGGTANHWAPVRVLWGGCQGLVWVYLDYLTMTDSQGHQGPVTEFGPIPETQWADVEHPGMAGDWTLDWLATISFGPYEWHNNPHSFTGEISYVVDYGLDEYGNPIRESFVDPLTPASIGFEKLVISNATAAPHAPFITWDPDTMQSVTLACSTAAVGVWNQDVIYDIRDPVTHTLIRSLTHTHLAPGSDSVVWDGKDDLGQDVPRGLYVYEIRTEINSGGQGDSEKSWFLSVSGVSQELMEYDEQTREATIRVHYTLNDWDCDATACDVVVIDPELIQQTSVPAPAVRGSPQQVDVEVTLDKAGDWYFMVCPTDDGSTRHRAHANHPALQRGVTRFVDIDLDVDSDNTNGYGNPDRSHFEDTIEDNPALNGKVLVVNNDDDDEDAIPDFADFENTAERFTPVVIDLLASMDPANALVRFSYDASDPSEVTATGNPLVYTPATGMLRLWRSPGNTPRAILDDYIASGLAYSAAALGAGGATTLYLEGIAASPYPGAQRILVEVDPDGEGPLGYVFSDAIRVTVIGVDQDVDSDNNNGVYYPARSVLEGQIEARRDLSGKVIPVNDSDDDADDVPDFADGFNADGETSADDANAVEQLTPLVIELPAPIDLTQARLRFSYDGSDPAGVMREGEAPDYQYVLPDQNHLRLWRKDGNADPPRSKLGVANDGDYVVPSEVYSAAQLGFAPGEEEVRVVTLYLEGISVSAAPGDQRILVEVDPDGDGPIGFLCADVVRLTVAKVDLILDALPEESQPSPHEENPGASILVNNDDDNENSTADREETGTVSGENDLVPASLVLTPQGLHEGSLVLAAATGADRIKVWTDATRGTELTLPKSWEVGVDAIPATVFVEGVNVSQSVRDVSLSLSYVQDQYTVCADRALATVQARPGTCEAILEVHRAVTEGGQDTIGPEMYAPVGGKMFVVVEIRIGPGGHLASSMETMTLRVRENSSLHAPGEAEYDLPTVLLNSAAGWEEWNGAAWVMATRAPSSVDNSNLNTTARLRTGVLWNTMTQPLGHNDEHTIFVAKVNGDSSITKLSFEQWVNGDWGVPYQAGPASRTATVRNVVVTNATTSCNHDYIKYDAESEEAALSNPYFDFDVEDAVDTHEYDCTVFFRPTPTESWWMQDGRGDWRATYYYVRGSLAAPGHQHLDFTSPIYDPNTGLPITDPLPKGTYTFDIYASEAEDADNFDWANPIDYNEMKTSYFLGLHSHDFAWRLDADENVRAYGAYRLTDRLGRNAAEVKIDVVNGDLATKASVDGPGILIDHDYTDVLLYAPTDTVSGDCRAIFRGLDQHADKTRDHRPNRMLAVNQARPLVTLTVSPCSDAVIGTDVLTLAAAVDLQLAPWVITPWVMMVEFEVVWPNHLNANGDPYVKTDHHRAYIARNACQVGYTGIGTATAHYVAHLPSRTYPHDAEGNRDNVFYAGLKFVRARVGDPPLAESQPVRPLEQPGADIPPGGHVRVVD